MAPVNANPARSEPVLNRPCGWLRLVLLVAAIAIAWLPARLAVAHELAMDQLLLMPDREHSELRGQVTFNPHQTRARGNGITRETEAKVLSAVGACIRVEIDGRPQKLEYSIRELWVPAGPTVGDIVMLRAPLPALARELRVITSASLSSLIVTVQVLNDAGAPLSQSVLVEGGSSTPPYQFSRRAEGWKVGGAGVFAPDNPQSDEHGPELTTPGVAAAAVQQSASPHSRNALWVSEALRVQQFFKLGFGHIFPFGWDHLLFVAALVLGSEWRLRRVILQLSAFTLAHSVTLALGALGWVVIAPGIIEPAIALSIAYVAFENLALEFDQRRRMLVAFLFGLLHGQGFAGSLRSLNLPREGFLWSLVSFNLGVEAGQLVAVLALCALLFVLRKRTLTFEMAVRQGSVAVGVIGFCVGVMRLLG